MDKRNPFNLEDSKMAKQKPANEIRLGRIKATIRANKTESGVRHNVQVRRLYKDGDNWKESDSF